MIIASVLFGVLAIGLYVYLFFTWAESLTVFLAAAAFGVLGLVLGITGLVQGWVSRRRNWIGVVLGVLNVAIAVFLVLYFTTTEVQRVP